MEKEFVPHNPALRLKAIGFDEPCVYYVDKNNNSYIYNFQTHPDEFIEWCGVNVIPTPTFSQAFRWFRKNHNLKNWVESIDTNHKAVIVNHYGEIFSDYEEAELACLIKLIEIVESKTE